MGSTRLLGRVKSRASVQIRDLHGITDRGNRGITVVKTAVMGNGFSILPW